MVEILRTVSENVESKKSTVIDVELTPTKLNGCNEKQKDAKQVAAEFEEAISASKLGWFNVLLMLCTMPGLTTAVYVSSTLSYVLTSAECDLNLNMEHMGILNIITYSGMLISAMLWGFLSDTLGRKKIMVWGFLCLSFFEILSSQSQTFWMLVVSKFCTGFIFNGPFAVLISYISEMHPALVRARVIIFTGLFYGLANIHLPLLAWVIIPNDWTISLFGLYELHSWNIFLLATAIPPLASSLAFAMLPESPKFLMSRGRNDEALQVFKTIYTINTGLPPDTYPIKCLVEETLDGKEAPRGMAAIKQGFRQIQPLFSPPHLCYLLLVCFINSSAMLGGNTLRLWFPQMATVVEDYNAKNDISAPLCVIISSHVVNKTIIENQDIISDCVKLETGTSTYTNSVIIGVGTLVTYLVGGIVIDAVRKRFLSLLTLLLSCFCALSLYWSTSFLEIVSLFTVFVSASSLTGTALSSIIVDLFPTSVRAMAVAIFLMMGRMGTVTGGLVFPHLLQLGCFAPFAFIAIVMFGGGLLCFVVPNTTRKKLV